MGRSPIGKTDSMTWVDMKNYRHKCMERVERLEKTIITIAIEEKNQQNQHNRSLMEQSYMEGSISKHDYVTTATPEPLMTEESIEVVLKKQL